MALAAVVLAGVVFAGAGAPARAETHLDELDLFTRTNVLRTSKGVAPLALDFQLTDIARYWSNRLARTGQLTHNPDLEDQVDNWSLLGENVGTGSDVASIQAAFEARPEYYRNLVDPRFQFVGVGVVDIAGTRFVTVDFKRAESLGSAPAPPAPIAPEPREPRSGSPSTTAPAQSVATLPVVASRPVQNGRGLSVLDAETSLPELAPVGPVATPGPPAQVSARTIEERDGRSVPLLVLVTGGVALLAVAALGARGWRGGRRARWVPRV